MLGFAIGVVSLQYGSLTGSHIIQSISHLTFMHNFNLTIRHCLLCEEKEDRNPTRVTFERGKSFCIVAYLKKVWLVGPDSSVRAGVIDNLPVT